MPLLKKNTFERASESSFLRDDEEVFYCSITNEIFRDYEEFSERMFLCNSMVWTCSMTGKQNLTYSEALESEENAKRSLKEFPSELKIPILYLASKTQRSAFGDMADDVFTYVKDRYFIGENVLSSFTDSKWKDSHVLQVIPPTAEQIAKNSPKNGSTGARHIHVPSNLYKYEIEHLDAEDEDISEIMIVDYNQIRRKKSQCSREQCKLFLKQYVEQDARNIFVIKPSAMDAFKIRKITFDQIFNGPSPEFPTKKIKEAANGKPLNGKKTKQPSMHQFLSKNAEKNPKMSAERNNSLLERMKKREEEFKLKKQQKKEESEALKLKKKEENVLVAGQLKDWYRLKEDLELEDQMKLPLPTPIKSKVDDSCLGDMLMVLEFVYSFSKLLATKDFFPGGLTFEIMERALTEKEVAGPLIDLLQMLLTALFNVQDEEATQYKTQIENSGSVSIKQEDVSENMNLHEATRLATSASAWSTKHQGLPLGRLPLYSLTTSEILRLHLLGSGAVINITGARWRYQQRGGYTSENDPGLYLRLHQPHILKALAVHNVVELCIADKLKILSCLVDQLLTYADVRDVIEERLDNQRQARNEYKSASAVDKKIEQELMTAKAKLKKEIKEHPELQADLEKVISENERKKVENVVKMEEFLKASSDNQIVMGHDRAFRQYLKLDAIPGLFIHSDKSSSGVCLSKMVKQNPDLINAGRKETIAHIKELLKTGTGSDKENSPTKTPKKLNGSLTQPPCSACDDIHMCSADPSNCIVHSNGPTPESWFFYYETEKLEDCIESLNKRGTRERDLQQTLKNNKDDLVKVINKTPVAHLNNEIEVEREEKTPKKSNKPKYEDANLGYPTEMTPQEILHSALVENILEMEEKIYAGNLGTLQIDDREKWRNALQSKDYKALDMTLNGKAKIKQESPPDSPSSCSEVANTYQDPGQFLGGAPLDAQIENGEAVLVQADGDKEAIHALAVALVQVGQSVERRYLKKPLGKMYGSREARDKKREAMLDKWEISLLASTSFSQVFLHYGTLDSCVTWARSALLARCRICRRQNDSENMLLCDSCNLGHHLYCLKPKLKSVPSGDWFCSKCVTEKKKEETVATPETPVKQRRIFRDDEDDEEENDDDVEESEDLSDAVEEEEDSTNAKVDLCKTCGSGGDLMCCEKCSTNYHIECVEPPLRRAPRGPWACNSCKKGSEKRRLLNYRDSSDDEVINRRSTRRDEVRGDLPLHNAALHEVLAEVMKDNNAWPFLRPVQKNEVPDYHDVITKPMDFGTIKYKLNMGNYTEDAQFMSDAVLVFQNCNTYNHTDDDVYKCGVQLLKHFQKKCREVGLKLPEEMDYNDSRPKKRQRTA